MESTVALVVAAGRGSRFGAALPKQYAVLDGSPVLRHSLNAFLSHPRITHVQAVIHPDDRMHYDRAAENLDLPAPVAGGATRQASVRQGLMAVAGLMLSAMAWDTTIKALESQSETSVSGAAATVRTSRAANSSDVIYSFIVLRAQFVTRYYRQLWRQPDAEEPPAEGGDDNKMGVFSLLKNLSGPQRMEFLTKQMTQWFFSLAASLGLLFFILVFMLVALILFGIAGLVKYAAILLMACFLFCFPLAYFFRGTAVLKPALGQVGVFILLKGAVILIIWVGFFLIEAVMLQGLRELAVDDYLVSNFADRAEPGFIYTDAGSSLLFAAEQGEQLARAQTASTKTMLSFLVILLAMLYIIIKLPAYINSMFGVSGGEDVVMTPAFVAAMAASAGSSLAAKGAGAGANTMAKGG